MDLDIETINALRDSKRIGDFARTRTQFKDQNDDAWKPLAWDILHYLNEALEELSHTADNLPGPLARAALGGGDV